MVKLDKINKKIEAIAEEALILEGQLNYSRQYQYYAEFIRKNAEILPEEVPDATYIYDLPGAVVLFRSIFSMCGCQVQNVVDLKDFKEYLKKVESLVGEMEQLEGDVLFSIPVQEY